MISFRIVSEPKQISNEIYGCVVITRLKSPQFRFMTFPVAVSSAICKEDVWNHVKGKNLSLYYENNQILVKMASKSSPLDEKEITGYLEFIAREPKHGELDVKSALGITVEEEVKRLRFGGQSNGAQAIPDAKMG